MVSSINSFPLNFAKKLSLTPRPQTQTTNADGTTTPAPTGNSQQASAALANTNTNLAAGQKATSVLSAYTYESGFFPGLPTQQSQITSHIIQNAVHRFTDAQTRISDTYKQKSDGITAVVNQWVTVKAAINNASAAVEQARKSMDKVSSSLVDMRGVISNAAMDAKFNAKAFDSNLVTINNQADRLGKSLNLVGSINRVDYSRNSVEYRNNISTGVSTLKGAYIGSDYRIEATDGTVWVPDLSVGNLTHYSELQGVIQTVTVTDGVNTAKLAESATYQTGIKLVSYDSKTNAIVLEITINPSDSPTTVTGTLQKTGIGLMPAWFYDSLNTVAGRRQAQKDVNEATAQVTLAGSKVQIAANTTATDSKHADNALVALNSKSSGAQLEQLKALQKLQTKYTQQIQAMQNNLNQLSSQQQNYLDMFAGQISSDPYLNVKI